MRARPQTCRRLPCSITMTADKRLFRDRTIPDVGLPRRTRKSLFPKKKEQFNFIGRAGVSSFDFYRLTAAAGCNRGRSASRGRECGEIKMPLGRAE